MRIRSCIFDLDGVIVDTARFHFLAWRRLANELGFDFSSEQNEKLKGVSRRESLEMILEWGQMELSEDEFLQWMMRKNEWYLEMVQGLQPSEALPGVIPFIHHLRDIGIHVALGSASRNAQSILNKLEITSLFEKIVDGNAVVNGKPAPDTFLKALEGTDIKPVESIVFEDSEKGIQAAHAGGFFAVGIGDLNALKTADVVLPGFEQIDFSQLISRLKTAKEKISSNS
jgi:beta-phosphoglucomutase